MRLLDTVPVGRNLKQPRHMLVLLRVEFTHGEGENYAIPLAFAAGDEARTISEQQADSILLRIYIRQTKEEGVLFDAAQDRVFPRGYA